MLHFHRCVHVGLVALAIAGCHLGDNQGDSVDATGNPVPDGTIFLGPVTFVAPEGGSTNVGVGTTLVFPVRVSLNLDEIFRVVVRPEGVTAEIVDPASGELNLAGGPIPGPSTGTVRVRLATVGADGGRGMVQVMLQSLHNPPFRGSSGQVPFAIGTPPPPPATVRMRQAGVVAPGRGLDGKGVIGVPAETPALFSIDAAFFGFIEGSERYRATVEVPSEDAASWTADIPDDAVFDLRPTTSKLLTVRTTGKADARPTVLTVRVTSERDPLHLGVFRQPIEIVPAER